MTQRLNERSGFTLLELLMVVIIIGILAALALPNYIKSVERSRASEVVTVLGQLRSAAQRYCAQSDGIPPALYSELDIEDPTTNTELMSRWGLAPIGGAVVCSPTYSFTLAATRIGAGPCAGSTVTMSTVAIPVFTYGWLGSCA